MGGGGGGRVGEMLASGRPQVISDWRIQTRTLKTKDEKQKTKKLYYYLRFKFPQECMHAISI